MEKLGTRGSEKLGLLLLGVVDSVRGAKEGAGDVVDAPSSVPNADGIEQEGKIHNGV